MLVRKFGLKGRGSERRPEKIIQGDAIRSEHFKKFNCTVMKYRVAEIPQLSNAKFRESVKVSSTI
jgi:hypothetical protein